MSLWHRIKRNILIKVLSALGFSGVIGFCIVSCDSKPASQENQNANTIETSGNSASPSNDKFDEPQSGSDTVEVVDNTNADAAKPEDAGTAELNTVESQPNSDTNMVALDNQEQQANSEAGQQHSAQVPEETKDTQPVEDVEVVSKKTEGAIKIECSPKNAVIRVNSKVICKKTPCYIKINHPENRVPAVISAEGYQKKKVVIDGSRPENTFVLENIKPPDLRKFQSNESSKPPKEKPGIMLYLI